LTELWRRKNNAVESTCSLGWIEGNLELMSAPWTNNTSIRLNLEGRIQRRFWLDSL